MDIQDKIIMVTGGGSGIGRETALALAAGGAEVVLTYNTGRDAAEKTFTECARLKGKAHMFHLDVRDKISIESLARAVSKEIGGLDALVNNAGVIAWKRFSQHDDADIEQQIAVNLMGLIRVTHAFLPQLSRKQQAVIVNIASVVGKTGYADLSVYCATKFGVRGFTQALARELPDHVRAYNLNPNLTATRMTNFSGEDPARVAGVVVRALREEFEVPSGGDIDVEQVLS
jgi:3-oxoacyl-[acyl-carrier protein] reductase